MTYQLTTLPNGLRVASETLPHVESVSLMLRVGAGARNESESENGISHLLEHMAFKGTTTRSARDIAESFDMIGGQINAYTSMENTVYYAKVLKDDITVAAEILGDIMRNSIFDEKELTREQEVIVQEIAMHRDAPDDLIHDYFDSVTFPNQPMGRSIMSTPEQVSSYTRNDLIAYMDRHYQTPRMVITAAGNITHDALVDLAHTHFAFPANRVVPPCPPAHYVGGCHFESSELEQIHLMMGLPSVDAYSPHYYAMQLYASILGGGMSSRLFQEVREKRGLAYTVYASGAAYDDCGVMTIYAATSPEKAGELGVVLCEQLVQMTKHIDEKELRRAKNQAKADLLMARESTQAIASWMGRHLLRFGEYRQSDWIRAQIDAVTLEDIITVGKNQLTGNLSVAALGDVSGVATYEELQRKLAS